MSKTQAPPPHADPQQLLTALGTTSRAVAHRIYRCTLVTPMYGGGVKPGVVDRELPFRPTAIRGQLRFWWRLLNRLDAEGRPRSPKALFEAERAIWGGLGDSESLARSNVSVRVRAVEGKIELRPAAKYEGKPHPIWESPGFGYALFPAADVNKNDGGREDTIAVTRTVEMLRSLGVRVQQPLDGNKEKKPADLLQPGASFELHLGFDEDLSEHQRHQVVRALHWWAAFGGLGARNRRGAGAFDVQEAGRGLPIPTMEEIREAGCRLVMRRATKSSMDAWNEAIKLLREFRQGEGLGRRGRGQSKTPGRSFWPEPDSIPRGFGAACRIASTGTSRARSLPKGFFWPAHYHPFQRGWPRQESGSARYSACAGSQGKKCAGGTHGFAGYPAAHALREWPVGSGRPSFATCACRCHGLGAERRKQRVSKPSRRTMVEKRKSR